MRKFAPNIGIAALWLVMVLLSSCNTAKFVPEGQYLLNKTKIKVEDTREVTPSDLKTYLRQTPNTEILGFWKLQLHIYNTAPTDTTTKSKKRLARNAHKMGEAPEIYNPNLTSLSMTHLRKAMQNKGFFRATVDTLIRINKRKLNITYLIQARDPYYLRNTSYMLSHPDLRYFALDKRHSFMKEGILFDADVLNDERQRIATGMRNMGYYYFERDMIRYEADSTVGERQVDVEMSLQPYIEQLPDSAKARLFRKYTIARVCFHMDYDPAFIPRGDTIRSSVRGNYSYTWIGQRLLRERVLRRTCEIKPGELFSQRHVDVTYAKFNNLGVIKYVDISFNQVGEDSLECHIVLSRSKLHSVSAEIEGTYAGGDWGLAAEVGYTNRNIFRGAEELSLRVGGSYEWRQKGGRAIEGKIEAGLRFPNSLVVNVGYQYQTRPDEFTRTIANAGLAYRLHYPHSKWTHTFKFIDISYVYLPWMSAEFKKTFLKPTNILKHSYEDHFIESFSYQFSYSSYDKRHPYRSYGTFGAQLELAGNSLYGLALLAKLPKDADGKYTLFNIRFAQYAKFDFGFTGHHIVNENHRLVYRGALGVAIPYGNAESVPFEKRYYAGGANGVRGWTARSLGPGSYSGDSVGINYDCQVGDIRLDLSLEYRLRIWKFIHTAVFVDAGNTWTIREYESQPGGAFYWDRFYKQIALSYGAGIRFDLSFLIFRIDLGVRLHDPARIATGKEWRTVDNGLSWSKDMTLHFAIGYPF